MTNVGNQTQAIMNDLPDDGKYRSKCVSYTKSGRINKILFVYTDGAFIIVKFMCLSDNVVPFLTKI